ncbi:helix-turn-helix domain-containing protein [Pedobacter sp.]|uniref:helix-turn-helix domain-containing protein n=1 Tax=Pedobacter sp. TaxID=1411316 RepID=UPI003C3878C5
MQDNKMLGNFISLRAMQQHKDNFEDHQSLGHPKPVLITSNVGGNFVSEKKSIDGLNSFLLCTKGILKLETNEGIITAKYKDLLILLPGTCYRIMESAQAGFIRVDFSRKYLKDTGVFLSNARAYQIFSQHGVHSFSLTNTEYHSIYSDLSAFRKKLRLPFDAPYASDIVRNGFIGILFHILLIAGKSSAFTSMTRDSKLDMTSRFLGLLAENFKKEKKVSYYADMLCVTPKHLSQVLKAVTSKTAGALIDEMVIKEARSLLATEELNISEVATKLYFSDSSFFGKYFKKHTGLSPSIFKTSIPTALIIC